MVIRNSAAVKGSIIYEVDPESIELAIKLNKGSLTRFNMFLWYLRRHKVNLGTALRNYMLRSDRNYKRSLNTPKDIKSTDRYRGKNKLSTTYELKNMIPSDYMYRYYLGKNCRLIIFYRPNTDTIYFDSILYKYELPDYRVAIYKYMEFLSMYEMKLTKSEIKEMCKGLGIDPNIYISSYKEVFNK